MHAVALLAWVALPHAGKASKEELLGKFDVPAS